MSNNQIGLPVTNMVRCAIIYRGLCDELCKVIWLPVPITNCPARLPDCPEGSISTGCLLEKSLYLGSLNIATVHERTCVTYEP